MGRKGRKFIDKKHDITHSFKVVQRSQKDPLVADEAAPQGVLLDTNCSDSHKEDLNKYGIYFDDDYDYIQHLRGVKETIDWEEDCGVEVYTIRNEDPKKNKITHKDVGLLLPSSAFESYIEEPVGLLNKAAPVTGPRPELDPDIVAKLDSDDDFDEGDLFGPEDSEAFPDDFVAILNSEKNLEGREPEDREGYYGGIQEWLGGMQNYDGMPPLEGSVGERGLFSIREFSNEDSYSESDKSGGNDSEFFVSDEEKDNFGDVPKQFHRGAKSDIRSRTSASSATVPRTELLTTLDDRFERLYNQEYREDQIGALDGELIEGPFDVNSAVFQQALRATVKQLEKNRLIDVEPDDRTVQWVKESMKLREYMQNEKQEMVFVEMKGKPLFDCESIISTYSTTRNRPQLIDDSDLFKKQQKLTKKAVSLHDQQEGDEEHGEKGPEAVTILSCISAISFRPKDETTEDRRERKQALKELRRERRKEKKLNQLAFKEELKTQKRITLSKPRCKVVQVS